MQLHDKDFRLAPPISSFLLKPQISFEGWNSFYFRKQDFQSEVETKITPNKFYKNVTFDPSV